MKFLDFGIPGGPDFLLLKEAPKPTCRDCEIVIQVAAAGLNLYDSLDRQRISYPYTRISKLGFECSGRVVAVGFYASKKFKVGDEVCAILQGGGGCAEFIAIPHSHALRIPPGVTLAQAAALPLASCLTLYAFSMWTTIASGKTILIHWDAGGIDTIAIQYAKHVLRCDVIAVAGMEENLQLCKMLGAEVCINYKKQDFCKCVKSVTGERGVDFILDGSGGAHFQKNIDCLAVGGSLIILGSNSKSWANIDLSVLMHKDINVIAKIWPKIESGHIKPIIGKEFSFSEATEAYKALVARRIAGKILLVSQ
ncbi:uncharacterized protein [Primulina eburnea]|uniref:uncharacterized protein isoform X2 n=1 Tax=Primulina eburnea TaxID=1245227 RepID=UPI003C6C6EE6